MDAQFGSLPLTNSTVLCIGGITHAEAQAASADGTSVDGLGYYLFLAQEGLPDEPIQVLAKFLSIDHAETVTRLLNQRMNKSTS